MYRTKQLTIFSEKEIAKFNNPPKFSAAQQQKFFTITKQTAIQVSKLHNCSSKVLFILQWGYFNATGNFFTAKNYNKDDIKYVATQLKVNFKDVDIKKCYVNIFRHHKKIIMKLLEFKAFNSKIKPIFKSMIYRQVQRQSQPKKIIYTVATLLHNQKIEVPNYSAFFHELINAYKSYENRLLSIVHKNIDDHGKQSLAKLLQKDNDKGL